MGKYILNKCIRLKYDEPSKKFYAFCISSGDHFVLTKTGYLILELIEKGKDINEIINLIHKKERIDFDTCKTDTLNFLNKSKENGIIAINKEVDKNDKKGQN